MKKFLLMIITVITGTFFCLVNFVKAVDVFPTKIKPTLDPSDNSNLFGRNEGYGWNIYKKAYAGIDSDNSGKAFCTSFHKDAPYPGMTCTAINWSTNAANEKNVAAAVGQIIYEARVDKKNGSMDWKNYYYAEMAINRFLSGGIGKGYGTTYNTIDVPSSISGNVDFKKYVNAANYAFENYGVNKIDITNANYDEATGVATAKVTCTDKAGSKTECDLTSKNVVVKIDGNTRPEITVEATEQNDKTIILTTSKIENSNNGQISIQFEATNKRCWKIAQEYECGFYQSLTPNLLKDECKEVKAKSPVVGNLILKVFKKDADDENVFINGASIRITYQANEQEQPVNLISENDGYIELVDGKFESSVAEPGIYCAEEVKSPIGYKLNSEKKCVTISRENPNDNTIIITNKKDERSLTINKVDENNDPVIGAEIEVSDLNCILSLDDENADSSECVIEKFVTDGQPKIIEGLAVGNKYKVSETKRPDGFADGIWSVDITIDADDSKNVVTLTNIHSLIKVSKQSITSTQELPGAKLVITDSQGNEIKSWTSTEEPQEIIGLHDGDYTLTEFTAPQGYTIAEKVNFTIENGVVKGDDDNIVVMRDSTIVDVPNTFSIRSILIVISGFAIIGLVIFTIFYELKRRKE